MAGSNRRASSLALAPSRNGRKHKGAKGALHTAVGYPEVGSINVDVSVTGHGEVNDQMGAVAALKSQGAGGNAVGVLDPPLVLSDLDKAFYLNTEERIWELTAHYASLIRSGYRATRWEHPRFGPDERLPDGRWVICAIHPDSPNHPRNRKRDAHE